MIFPLTVLFLAVEIARGADPVPSVPSAWREAPATGGWSVEGDPASAVLVSSTRTDGASAIIRSFPVASGPVELSFTALAPATPGHRGLNFGIGWRQPELQGYRAAFLTFGGSGQVLFWDPGLVPERSSNVGAYEAGRPTRIRMRIDPSLGGFTIEVNDRSSNELFPFFAGIPRVDSIFFTNASTRPENSPLRVSDIVVRPALAPPTPRGIVVRPLSPTEAEVAWKVPISAGRVRIQRLGKTVGETDARTGFWRESGLPAGRAVAYRLTSVDSEGRESLPSWPVDLLLPLPRRKRAFIDRFDVVVVGGTPSGIAASLAAARRGARVLLTLPDSHLGGMMSGGLGRTDYRYRGAQLGIFAEFARRVQADYDDAYGPASRTAMEASGGYHFESGVAAAVFRRMLDEEPRVAVRIGLRPVEVRMRRGRLTAVTFEREDGRRETIRAPAFIDAAYEGDLLALAGVGYRIGRESRADFDEPHAGVIYWDVDAMDFLPGSTGEGDRLVQAYNYRLPLTNRAGHRYYAVKPPEGYDRTAYASIADDVKAGRIRSIERVMHFRRVPGEEFDVNNHRYYPSTDAVGRSNEYPDATPETRAEIARAHRRHIEGLLYFLQNDPSLPPEFRFDANQWGFAQDEFPDNQRFPAQLYVREARRMVGTYTFRQRDAMLAEGKKRPPVFRDGIAVGDYMMDSHATRPQEKDRPMGVLEGFFFIPALTRPYQIPYRILVPEKVDGLLATAAVSATHVGYGTLRMEPVMMAMGEAAGVSTRVAAARGTSLRDVPIHDVQAELIRAGATLTYYTDLSPDHPAFQAFQYLGVLGLVDDTAAAPDAPVNRATAVEWFRRIASDRGRNGLAAPWDSVDALAAGGDEEDSLVSREELSLWLAVLAGKKSDRIRGKYRIRGFAEGERVTRGDLAIALYRIIE